MPFCREIPARDIHIAAREMDVTRDTVFCDVLESRRGRTSVTRRAIVNHGGEGTLGREEGLGGTKRERRVYVFIRYPYTLDSFF